MTSPFGDPIVSLALAPLAPPAGGPGAGTRSEAMAMVKRAQGKFRTAGAAATFTAINTRSDGFVDRDLYAFVYDLRGVSVAHAAHAELVGQNLIRLRDHGGRHPIRDMIEVAQARGSGWIDFRLVNPATNTIELRSAYLERMDGYVVGVGVGGAELSEPATLPAGRDLADTDRPIAAQAAAAPLPPAEIRVDPATSGVELEPDEMSPRDRLFTEFRRAKRLKIMKTNALRRRPGVLAATPPRRGGFGGRAGRSL
jgi:hypothetical protein